MNNKLFNIYIGYDGVESVAWHVMAHSIFSKSSVPVAFIPVSVNNLQGIYDRVRDPKQSNEFSFTRFLVPYLNNYQGYAVFFDCDMLVRTDINELLELIKADPNKAVYVVKHDYVPKDTVKYLNTVQYTYPRKNWSSVVVWNCGHPDNMKLTPNFINTATGIELHRFTWLKDEDIGELDIRWNWLVGEYDNPPSDVKNVHWTIGGPYFTEYADADFAKEWFDGRDKVNFCKQRDSKK